FFETKHPRLGIARLRTWRHGADLDKAETEPKHCVGNPGILVVAGGEPQGVREFETPEALRQGRRIRLASGGPAEKTARAQFERSHRQLVRGFREQPAHDRTDQPIDAGHGYSSVASRRYGR